MPATTSATRTLTKSPGVPIRRPRATATTSVRRCSRRPSPWTTRRPASGSTRRTCSGGSWTCRASYRKPDDWVRRCASTIATPMWTMSSCSPWVGRRSAPSWWRQLPGIGCACRCSCTATTGCRPASDHGRSSSLPAIQGRPRRRSPDCARQGSATCRLPSSRRGAGWGPPPARPASRCCATGWPVSRGPPSASASGSCTRFCRARA